MIVSSEKVNRISCQVASEVTFLLFSHLDLNFKSLSHNTMFDWEKCTVASHQVATISPSWFRDWLQSRNWNFEIIWFLKNIVPSVTSDCHHFDISITTEGWFHKNVFFFFILTWLLPLNIIQVHLNRINLKVTEFRMQELGHSAVCISRGNTSWDNVTVPHKRNCFDLSPIVMPSFAASLDTWYPVLDTVSIPECKMESRGLKLVNWDYMTNADR